jgi:DNA polymerase III epsilon subunit-like protein
MDNNTNNMLFLDVETNGIGPFRPAQQRVVQIAWILNDVKKSYFISGVSAVSEKVPHKYNVAFLQENGSEFKLAIEDFFIDLKKASHVVAHNADFDIGCILNELRSRQLYHEFEEEFTRKKIVELKYKKVIDTMKMSVNICKIPGKFSDYKWPSLDELYIFCFSEKPTLPLHDALNDCLVTKMCLNMLLENNMLKLN